MGVFNYSRFHYFDKNGHELILNSYPDVRFKIANHVHPEFPADYALVKSTPDNIPLSTNSSIVQIDPGMRFYMTDASTRLDVSTFIRDTSNNITSSEEAYIINGSGKSGLRISILGDSISTYNQEGYKIDGYAMYYPAKDVNNVNDTWWMQLINRSHCRLDINASYSGSTSSSANFGFERRVELLDNPNIIFVALGTNDSVLGVPIGNFDFESDSLDLSKFAPSYINGIKKLKRLYKNAKIICIAFSMGEKYADAIRIVAKHTGCDYLDMRSFHDPNGDPHPTKAVMYNIATYIMNRYPELFSSQYKKYNIHDYQSSFGLQNYPELLYNDSDDNVKSNFLDVNNLNLASKVNFFPTYSFKSRMEFDKVSTELVETQTVYVLVENEFATDKDGRKIFTTVGEYAALADQFLSEYNQMISRINEITQRIKELMNLIDQLNEQIREYEELGIDPCDLVIQRDELITELRSLQAEKRELDDAADQKYKDYLKCKGAKDYATRFRLMFFVDCRDQKDFRFFRTKYDELTWSDRSFINFNKKYSIEESDNGYSVNIGFSGELDGVYQQPMYVCLIDTYNTENSEIGEAYPIGEIMLNAEAEGEDERYRTFFENFGIPDPKEYDDIFSDTDISDDLPDYVSINRNSKKLYLAYSEIFPYIGSYKALVNAIRYLGYDDVFFKEWYKEIGNSAFDDSGYTTYEISYGNTSKKNTIDNLTVEERIHLRKMNWVSMIYRLNEELDKPEDMCGFPTAITNVRNFNTERLAKLISLKDWIDKYATGVNCRVIDISGEGLVFERYNLQKWGSYQQVLEYNNEKAISPVPVTTACALEGGEADIQVDIYTNDQIFTIGELENTTFVDYCEGYFNENNKFVECNDSSVKDNQNYVYFGKTFELNDNMNTFQLRLKGEHSTYRFGKYFIENSSMPLLVEDDSIIFDYTYSLSKNRNTIFTKLPVIQIEEGVIKRYKQNDEPKGTYEYIMKMYQVKDGYNIDIRTLENFDTFGYKLQTVPTFMPPVLSETGTAGEMTLTSRSKKIDPTRSEYIMTGHVTNKYEGGNVDKHNGSFGLRYCIDNVNGIPCFKIVGYEEKHLWDDDGVSVPQLRNGNGYEYIVEIKNGRMLFNDDDNNVTVALNFSYDEKTSHQRIYVTTFKTSECSTMYEYMIGQSSNTKRFENGKTYNYFINRYKKDPSSVITYNNRKSISVNHTGIYQVDAILYDRFNNVFSKTSDTKVNVLPSYTDIKLFISESQSGETSGISNGNQSATSNILGSSQPYILGYTPKLRITDVIDNGVIKFAGSDNGDTFQDDGTVLSFNKTDYDMANISSLSDRIDLSSVSGNTYIFVKKSTHKSHLTPNDNRYGTLEYDTKYVSKAMTDSGITKSSSIDTDISACYNKLNNDITKGSMFDAKLVIYDEVCEKIIDEILCVYLPYKAYGTTPYDQYKVMTNGSIGSTYQNDSRYSFYLIPRWCVKVNKNGIVIHGDNGENFVDLNTNIFDSYFCRNIDKNSSEYVYYKKVNDYHGFGLYRQISDDKKKTIVEPFSSDNEYDNSVKKFSNYTDIWFSSGDISCQKYPCAIVNDDSDTHKQYVKLMDNDILNNNARFIDSQYSVSLRNFDPEDAENIWKGNNISLSGKYEYNVPVITKNNTVYAAPTVDMLYNSVQSITGEDITVRWRVYRRIGLVERNMLIECYNKALSLNLPYYGKYDIEVDVFDKYGNKYTKEMGGAITYRYYK